MANNFRLSGNVYVSKDGSDANSGLTPDLPKLTIQAGINATVNGGTLIIGSGTYQETLSFGPSVLSSSKTMRADGEVICLGTTVNDSYFGSLWTGVGGGTSSAFIYGIKFINYQRIIGYSANLAYANGFTTIFYDCTFYNLELQVILSFSSQNGSSFNFNRCKFVNVKFIYTNYIAGFIGVLDYCILINCNFTLSLLSTVTNSYWDVNTIVVIRSSANYNNIQGRTIVFSNGAVSGASSNGVALFFEAHRTDYPSINTRSINEDPEFNDVKNLDFTLQSTSPHIVGASDQLSNIGGTEYAKHYTANSTEFTSGATITDLTLLGSNTYTITAPATEGRIITAPLSVQPYPATKPLTGIMWVGSLEFNKSVTAGTQGNQQVPAYDTYTTGGGASPDRLKIKMRYSTQSASPTAGQWDNGGYWAVDTYQLIEVNMKPKVDSNGIGNGDYTYIEFVGFGDLVPTWIQLDIKLRNDYNP